jgi:NAD(P)-dependent dehydrogenase (short-subunit alcohol dehydrogenase family)
MELFAHRYQSITRSSNPNRINPNRYMRDDSDHQRTTVRTPNNMDRKKTVIVTGASQGIGAAITQTLIDRGYNVVANSRRISTSSLKPLSTLALVDGDIGHPATAESVGQIALSRFGSIDHLINNAGIYASKPFTEYSADDLRGVVSTNLDGFVFMTQIAVRQMLNQGSGGSVTTITAALADNPIAGAPSSIPMITKGGLNAVTLSLANEYAGQNIRFNAVAPGVVDTPMHEDHPKAFLKSLSPMATISEPQDVVDAVVYLVEARYVTGEVLHVDGGAHVGRW